MTQIMHTYGNEGSLEAHLSCIHKLNVEVCMEPISVG